VSDAPVLDLEQASLLIIPCSQSKRPGSKPTASRSILTFLAVERSQALSYARAALRQKASVDDTLMSAHLRYRGSFYDGAAGAIVQALRAGHKVVTVSGGYGVLLAEEPIGSYKRRLSLGDWPKGLLESCLIDYASSQGVRSVFAFMSRSSAYYKTDRAHAVASKWPQGHSHLARACARRISQGSKGVRRGHACASRAPPDEIVGEQRRSSA